MDNNKHIDFKESKEFYYFIKKKLFPLVLLMCGLIIYDIYLIFFGMWIVSNEFWSLIKLLLFIDFFLIIGIVFGAYKMRKELAFRRFQLGNDFLILPYITGIRIPRNRIPFASIKEATIDTTMPSIMFLYIDVESLRKQNPTIKNIKKKYIIEIKGGELIISTNNNNILTIVADENDFSQESYLILKRALIEHNILHS